MGEIVAFGLLVTMFLGACACITHSRSVTAKVPDVESPPPPKKSPPKWKSCATQSNAFYEMFSLTRMYWIAQCGMTFREMKKEEVKHGLTKEDLRFRILRVSELAHEWKELEKAEYEKNGPGAYTHIRLAEYRNIMAIVAGWVDELYEDIEIREIVKGDICLFKDELKLPKGYELP